MSKIDVQDESINVSIIKRGLHVTTIELTPADTTSEQDYCAPIIKEITQPSSSSALKNLKNFVPVDKELYYKAARDLSLSLVHS